MTDLACKYLSYYSIICLLLLHCVSRVNFILQLLLNLLPYQPNCSGELVIHCAECCTDK